MADRPITQAIFSGLIADLFDVPVMGNLYRPHYVERMIAIGLGDGFTLTSADWSSWDIEHATGARIEVKQSAARQTWTDQPPHTGEPTAGSFDVAPRTGYWSDGGSRWVPQAGRHAHLYILAWHSIFEIEFVDHRDPAQWTFFVLPTEQLSEGQKTISRRVVEKRWRGIRFEHLRESTLHTIYGLHFNETTPAE